ncbi:hypothetical protein DEU34_0159 [Microbacterium sp. AG1240]|uniref:transglutaminase domain-containing protein n=1 Tax=Microbacterium sp. AG1240 TaxID=2183992 RepID=UPI000EAC231B|nr:transglutaminase domain-containing protein [Microbacterium sp. AG1240]RKT35656.1 hypothetical protein DEU34_0159 [Microbacterium sp. AG1240]
MFALVLSWGGAVLALLVFIVAVLLLVLGFRRLRARRDPDASTTAADPEVLPSPEHPQYDPANPHYRDGHQYVDGAWVQVQAWDSASRQWFVHGVDSAGAPTARAVGVTADAPSRAHGRGAVAMLTIGGLLAVAAVPLGLVSVSPLVGSVAAAGGLPTEIVHEDAAYRYTAPTEIDADQSLRYEFRVDDDAFAEEAYENNVINNGMVAAFFDSGLTLLADYRADSDFVDNSVTLVPKEPGNIDDSATLFGGATGSWAPLDALYLVQYIDRDGNAYDKPIVTRAQIRKHDTAPATPEVQYAPTADGYLDLTWTAVPGAESYSIVFTRQSDRGGNTYTVLGTVDASATTWSSRGAVPEDCYFVGAADTVQNCALAPVYQAASEGLATGYGVVALAADGTPSFMQRFDATALNDSLPGEVAIERPVGTTTWYSGAPESFPTRARAVTVGGTQAQVPLQFDRAERNESGTTGWIYARAAGTAATVRLGWDGIDGSWDAFVEGVRSRLDSATPEKAGLVNASFLEVAEPLPADIPISRERPVVDFPVPDEFGEIGEYVAANLIAGNRRIDMDAVANPFSDRELVEAVISQTPYAYVGQYSFASVDGRTVLEVSYDLEPDAMRDLQERTREKARAVVAEVVREGMSERDIALALNDWMTGNAVYDYAAFENVAPNPSLARDPEYAHAWRPDGVLLAGTAVCGGYAETFKVLSDEAGLDTVYVLGMVGTVGHAWNKTYWDGQWWVIDTTWNDTTPANELFAISDAEALDRWEHELSPSRWTIPSMVAQYATP